MKSVVRTWLAGAAAVLLGVAVLGVAVVVATPFGAAAAFRLLAERVPGELSVGRVRGSVAGTLVLHDVRYRSDGLGAAVDRLELRFAWSLLGHGRLALDRLAVDGGTVLLAQRDDAAPRAREPPTLPELPDWVAVRELTVADVDVGGLGVPLAIERLAGTLDGAALELDTVRLRAESATVAAAIAVTLGPAAAGTIEGDVLLPATGDAAPPSRIALAATFALAPAAEPWSATIEWRTLTWQGSPAGDLRSPRGRLAVTPGTVPIGLDLTAVLDGALLPDTANVTARAALAGETLDVAALRVETLGGALTARGTADLGTLGVAAEVALEDLDPAALDARMTGRVSGRADVSVAFEPALAAAVVGTLDGRLGERRLEGRADARFASGELSIAAAEVELEGGHLELTGTLTEEAADLGFSADLPELGAWYPPAAGRLTVAGAVRGDPSNPDVALALDGRGLALEDAGVPALEELTIVVDGTRAAHTFRVAGVSELGRFDFASEQSYASGRITGRLVASALTLERGGAWRLRAPAAFAVDAATRSLEQACLGGPGGGVVCVTLAGDALTVEATAMPNELFAAAWLPPGVTVAGAADAELELELGSPLQASLSISQPLLAVTAPAPANGGDTEPLTAEIEDLRVTGALTDARLEIALTAALAATGDPIEGAVTLTPPSAEGVLDGALRARLTDLALVDALADSVDGLTGAVSLRAAIGGSLAAPELEGTLDARGLNASLPPLGIEITDGRLAAAATGLDGITFGGRLCSGGCVDLDGRLRLGGEERWSLDGTLAGERFLLVALDDVRAVISPALQLDGNAARWRLTGTLGLPEGALEIATVPRTAVRPAPETVVHGREEPVPSGRLLPPLVIDVTARLGEVHFDGLGIAAELDGTVNVQRTAEAIWRANGTTVIEEGTFSAYGQDLTIERGLLIFTGPPDNPALDVRAVRMVDGTRVGLTITGTASAPRSVVFSEPALPESEAFARLLTGRSLTDVAGGADEDALERAALGLGLRRALPTLDRLGANLGLDELGVGEGGQGALVAGRQLGEDVYLRYRHGLFDDFSGLELIYRITERFRLRTETGSTQSIDLIYEVGRGRGGTLDSPADVAGPEQAARPADVAAEPN